MKVSINSYTTKFDNHLIELTKLFKEKSIPIMPIKADFLMSKYKIPEGKILGNKLKLIEDIWAVSYTHLRAHET